MLPDELRFKTEDFNPSFDGEVSSVKAAEFANRALEIRLGKVERVSGYYGSNNICYWNNGEGIQGTHAGYLVCIRPIAEEGK